MATQLTGGAHDGRGAPRLRPAIGAGEGIAIRLAGLRDRLRCRRVADGLATHWVHELQARVQAEETRAVRMAGAVLAQLDQEIAAVSAVLAQPLPEVAGCEQDERVAGAGAVPGARRPDGDHPTGRGVHEEAVRHRAERLRRDREQARRAAARSAWEAARSAREQAVVRRGVLLAERAAVLHQLTDAQQAAREVFDARAARYTRARTGWLGLARQVEHRVPAYTPAPGPAAGASSVLSLVTAPTAPKLSASTEEDR